MQFIEPGVVRPQRATQRVRMRVTAVENGQEGRDYGGIELRPRAGAHSRRARSTDWASAYGRSSVIAQ